MTFKSFDGKEIFVHEWTVEHPKGIVQIIHGMTEHAQRYQSFARFLNENGYMVVADDHRGHGKTDEESLGYCKGKMFFDTVKDEEEITKYYQRRYVGVPYFVFGFSYGSFIAQSYLASGAAQDIDGVVIGGSSYKKDVEVYFGSLVANIGCLFGEKKPAKLIERLSFGKYEKQFEDGQWLSCDRQNNENYCNDALCGFICSNRFYADFFKGLRSLYTKKYRNALRKDLPILIASGEFDAVGNMGKGVEKLKNFYQQKVGVKSVHLVLFPEARHEFLNEEEDRDQKWGTILTFFDEHSEGRI